MQLRRGGRTELLGRAAEPRAASAKGRGSWSWPQNKGSSVARKAEAGGGGPEVRKVRSHRAL